MILARAQDRPVVYVFEWFHRFPVGIVSPEATTITEPGDLTGRKVGVPILQGASYVGLRALLSANNLSEDDIDLQTIGYTAPDSVCEGVVEAAVVYIANEPLTIVQNCNMQVNVIEIADYVNLVSNGLVTNEKTIRDNPELVEGIVHAISRGLEDTLADPDAAFDISVKNYVTDLPEDQYDTQRQVLENSLALWQSDELGHTNPAAWVATQDILVNTGLLTNPLADVSVCYNMDFLPDAIADDEND
ncbi:MAG: ABC transporter substrate-binding protein [Chloroflexi bacterium]|nr:ABC transporter substrate-binding protein [Chloroflexota bacterium]